MGAPKQKWNAEEEAALKAGVRKHGTGKWRTILSDPEFSSILNSRSNVDLKDKWRNINVTAIWGSRQKAKLALQRNQPTINKDESLLAPSDICQDEETNYPKPRKVSGERLRSHSPKEPISRLENLILEAIMNLKQPSGSDKPTIALYIKDRYCAPENFRKLLAAKLKLLTENGTLLKVKQKYRLITCSSTKSESRKKPPLLLQDGKPRSKPKDSSKAQRRNNRVMKSHVDSELNGMNMMTIQQAALAAAQAVAEAEFAIMEAHRAAREAEYAEAKAEAAIIFFKAAQQAVRYGMIHAW